jgi:CHAD domain-containing protein
VSVCLEKSYAGGRDAGHLALRQPSPGHLHAWRKRVKDLWYQLDFLCPEWPPATGKMLAGLEKLGEELGKDHDLVLLEQFAREQRPPYAEAAQLQELIDARRKQHGAVIRRLGAGLYAQPPDEVCVRLEKDWSLWRNG